MANAPTDPFLKNLPDAFPWGVALLDGGSGRVLSANAHMRELYGCEADGEVDQLFHKHGGEGLSAVVAGLSPGGTWTGRIYPQRNYYGIASVDVMLQREEKAGATVWLYTLEHPKVDDDVRYSSRSELKMLRVLLDNTLEYIYFRDREGHFILTNRAFRSAISGSGQAPDMDHSMADFVTEESAGWFHRLDREFVASGRAVVNQVARVTLKNGLKHWLQLSVVPVKNGEGELIGSLSVARDISDLKRTEADLRQAIDRAHAASRAKGEFLAAMSHEIRTPINGIIGASELCEETQLDREQKSYVNTVLQCGKSLLSLVNDVLDFSKIEAGHLELEQLPIVPRTLVDNVAESFLQEARKKGVTLTTSCDRETPEYLMGDPTRLQQVLNNLVSNAIKFTEKGEIAIRVETVEASEIEAKVRFSVSDTGIGISAVHKDAMFESFTQADMSTSRKYGGTGLGLSISRQLVEMMGGKISVTSELGRGSEFFFEVPLKLGSGTDSPPARAEALPLLEVPLNVLLVEDNPVNQVVAERRLEKLGHRVTLAEGSREALEAIRGQRFDCILMDIQMPDVDGFAATAEIRKFEKERGFGPQYIVAMTAHAMKGVKERCLRAGMDHYIAKPFQVEHLNEVLHHALKDKERKKEVPGGRKENEFVQFLETLDVEDREDLLEASRIFIENLPDDIRKMQRALNEQNFNECYFMAHNIKGVVGQFGQRSLGSLAKDLEQACKNESEQEAGALVEKLVPSLEKLAREMKAALQ